MLYFRCILNDEILELNPNCKINNQPVEDFLISIKNDLNNISIDFVNIEFNGCIGSNDDKHFFQIHKSYLFTNKTEHKS